MTKKIKIPELLAPAGSLEKLKTAFLYGADAVYIGGESYSLRVAAENFSLKELKISTKEDVSVYKSIESDFFKNFIADILRFFENGEVSFDVEQTLKVMQIRETVIKAMRTPGEIIKLSVEDN